jgi:lipopolysaccharide/colanic/teichoic acid biosynthesis glycosyltransferase
VLTRAAKRALDVSGALSLLVLLCPLLLIVWAVVRATSPGPALFRQERVGLRGNVFEMLKFRSMYDGCDPTPHRTYVSRMMSGVSLSPRDGLFKLGDDPRITPVGAILRRLSLDELPQLVNVLRGDMSLVGPRPALAWEVDLFPSWAATRFSVRPGLTGLWQVSGRNRLTMMEGLELDVRYVERPTLSRDLVILLRTLPAVLGRGAR